MVLQLWADVKYHVPTGFGFSPKASGFYPFGDATALAGEGGVGDVVWLIQASASNHKPKANQRDGSFAKKNIFDCHNLSATFTNFAKQS